VSIRRRHRRHRRHSKVCMGAGSAGDNGSEPILLRAARGELVERPPVWLMRQAGRYMAAFREYSEKYPFRKRSETPEIAIELSLQPWRAFQTDAVIMFSDILTPLPSIGIEFNMLPGVGPKIENPVRTLGDLDNLASIDQFSPQSDLEFVGEILGALRQETANKAALLGFVGCPWTLAAYTMEGKGDKSLVRTKSILFSNPELAHGLIDRIGRMIEEYAVYQVTQGAQAIQLFDSWAHHLSPKDYETFSLPYSVRVAKRLRAEFGKSVPIIFFANGCGGKLEMIGKALAGIVDVIQVDWSVNIADARARLGHDFVIQGNVDPTVLFGPESYIKEAVEDCCAQAGRRHILNLGHGVLQRTPEKSVALFCETARNFVYDRIPERV